MKNLRLTVLIPCLNEEETIEKCIKKSLTMLKKNKIDGEVLVVDNGSTDNSYKLAKKAGARVVKEEKKGYGNALITGINQSYGKYVIMGDADCSYDFDLCPLFLEKLEENYDIVIGNRFKGGIEKGAMPFSHKYIGNPSLSFVGRVLYKTKVKDFHCGLRGFDKEKIISLNLQSPGMEFASEMICKGALNNYSFYEIPIKLYKDERIETRSHLSNFRDGFRHLKLMFKIKYKKIK